MAITKIYTGTIEQADMLFNFNNPLFSIHNYQSLNSNQNIYKFRMEIRSSDVFYAKLRAIKTLSGLIKLFKNNQTSEY